MNVRVGEEMYQRRGGSKYFESEKGLQDYMLKNKMINHSTYIKNVKVFGASYLYAIFCRFGLIKTEG